MDFYESWEFLRNHPMYVPLPGATGPQKLWADSVFPYNGTLDIFVAKVNPTTDRVEEDETLNTQTQIWLESGPWYKAADHPLEWQAQSAANVPPGEPSHDWRLDCGANTFEEAIVLLAENVRGYYKDDGTEREPSLPEATAASS